MQCDLKAVALHDALACRSIRWKLWKLDNDKIKQLTCAAGEDATAPASARIASVLNELGDRIADLRFFARGKRGVLYAGETRDSRDAPVVVKIATTTDPTSVTLEARWLRVMNRMGIGARLSGSGDAWLMCERLDGLNIVEFLSAESTTRANARWALREMLCQCFAMDLAGVNKEEMTHPHRHIIISPSAEKDSAPWRCTFIDFEKCNRTKKPKNITQLCQFLTSPRMVALLGAKGVVCDRDRLRQCTKPYKQRIGPITFGAIMTAFGL